MAALLAARPWIPPRATEGSARELVGLWEAKRRFGPDVRGTLTIQRRAGASSAEIAGRSASVEVDGGRMAFELADGQGAFRGELDPSGKRLTGFWTQPPSVQGGGQRFASPVTLLQDAEGLWRGDVWPLDDQMALYLSVAAAPGASTAAFLRNPERNLGVFMDVTRIEQKGDAFEVIGHRFRAKPEVVLARGTFDPDNERLIVDIPNRGGTYDFDRIDAEVDSGFYPHGKRPGAYRYSPPPALSDGWPVGTLEEAGIAREPIERFVQMLLEMPMDSVHASEIHGLLIARRGKLVLEEYFHGFHRDAPHDTRSAAKSLTATLVGAAIHDGAPLDTSSPVYRIMHAGAFPPGLEARKQALTVEHLLTMSSGLDCDDADPASPGNEDTMQEQTDEPDWYRFTINLGMIRDPGEKAIYCSCNPNLLGGVLQNATGQPLPELFDRLIAKPLDVGRYHLNLTPTGDAYMGGGVYWWVMEVPFKERTVRAFFAGGNGGQAVIGVPELQLLVTFYGGNYSDPVLYRPQREFVPKYVLPAVDAMG